MSGDFEQLVLLAILRLGADACGSWITNEICNRGGRVPRPGSVYTTLARLEKKGYVTSRTSHPRREVGGRSRRCYTVTPIAQRRLAVSLRALRRMSEGIDLPPLSTVTSADLGGATRRRYDAT